MFKPTNRFLWDFWILKENKTYTLFYLTAPIDPNPETRHSNAKVAMATSQDLKHWSDKGIIFSPPDDEKQWDNRTIWTGSVLKINPNIHNYKYVMMYTGTNKIEKATMQRIGLAFSNDLINWSRSSANPLEVDQRFYATHNPYHYNDTAWRDPWIYFDEKKQDYSALITAENKNFPQEQSGCVAIARSKDLIKWRCYPPITPLTPLRQMEVPFIHYHNKLYYLFVNATQDCVLPNTEIPRKSGTFYFTSATIDKDYQYKGMLYGVDSPMPQLYTPKFIKDPQENLVMLAWKGYDENNNFGGYLIDPIPVTFSDKGAVILNF